jgi:hypothetical protein
LPEVLQAHEVRTLVPKASCCSTLWYSAWPAGQKKNTRMIAIWGAISTQGSHRLLKRTRFSTANAFLLKQNPSPLGGEGTGEGCRGVRSGHRQQVRQDLLAFSKRSSCSLPRFLSAVQAFLGALLAGPDLFELLVIDGADLHEVAQADAARLVGGLADHLRDAHVGARVLLVEAALLGQLEAALVMRQVAGALVALGLHSSGWTGRLEELGHALVLAAFLPDMTHRLAPPITVFCGAPGTSG